MWKFPGSKPACPIDGEYQRWVDGRFRWLQDAFGEQTPQNARVILPTPEFFPDPYHGRQEDVQAMLVRVAGYMNVDPGRFNLFLYSDAKVPVSGSGRSNHNGSAGLYVPDAGKDANGNPRAGIGIEGGQLADPVSLVATLAHEVGHEILLGQGRISRDESDHEQLTDLLTVFLGMGIFTANATIKDRGWSGGGWHGWQTKRLGYLDQRTFGYALARFAWARKENKPSWIKSVRPDVRSPLKQGLRFLANVS